MTYARRGPSGWAVHPGEILNDEFMRPLGLSGYALAKVLGVNAQRVSDIVLEKVGISAEMAMRLSRYFGTTPEFWMNLQSAYELSKAQTSKTVKNKVNKINPRKTEAA